MLEKLKAAGESAKAVLMYVLTPLAFILGYVYYLTSQNNALKEDLKAGKRGERNKELENETKEVDSRAESAVGEYERVRSAYLQRSDQEVRSSLGGAEGTDSDQGSED